MNNTTRYKRASGLRALLHILTLFAGIYISMSVLLAAAPLPAHAKEPIPTPIQTKAKKQKIFDKIFNAKTFTLKNGLQVVVVENHRVPVVTHMVWYKVGAADEPRGKSGIAHFLEHLMFKGQSYPKLGEIAPGEFSKIIRSLGGHDNAFTAQDYTAFFQTVASKHLETIMRMEAGRMRGLSLSDKDVLSERNVIIEERRQRIDNDPRAKFNEQMNEALFPNHPYSIPIIGWLHEMKTLSREDAKSFYDLWYAPNNAILVVSGDVTVNQVRKLAEKTYGIIPAAKNLPVRKRTKSPPFIAKTSVSLTHPVVKEPVFERKYRVPSSRENMKESLALQVLEEIMDGGPTSRLYKSLVVEKKIASSVSLSYNSFAWNDTTLSVSAIPSKGYSLKDVENAIDKELLAIINNGIGEKELSEAKRRMQADAIYARDSITGPAMVIGYTLATGSSLDDLEYWPQHVEEITAKQVQDVARRYLNPDKLPKNPPVSGYLHPPKNTGTDKGTDKAQTQTQTKKTKK